MLESRPLGLRTPRAWLPDLGVTRSCAGPHAIGPTQDLMTMGLAQDPSLMGPTSRPNSQGPRQDPNNLCCKYSSVFLI